MKNFFKKAIGFASVLVFLSQSNASAQDVHFSQFYETSVLRNPALIGIYNGDYRFGLMYRNQWSSISAVSYTHLDVYKRQLLK